jgi:hypothetical protein
MRRGRLVASIAAAGQDTRVAVARGEHPQTMPHAASPREAGEPGGLVEPAHPDKAPTGTAPISHGSSAALARKYNVKKYAMKVTIPSAVPRAEPADVDDDA